MLEAWKYKCLQIEFVEAICPHQSSKNPNYVCNVNKVEKMTLFIHFIFYPIYSIYTIIKAMAIIVSFFQQIFRSANRSPLLLIQQR